MQLAVNSEIEALSPWHLYLADQADCLAVREKDSEALAVIEDTDLVEQLLFDELTVAFNDLEVLCCQRLEFYLLELLEAVFAGCLD